ncbi:restin (Reed-Steinberg cell-expressed intermediate filament-associated protein) [Aphelenchoides avenae]|nr:restin (Reed-Steinberg cell-expressed intermediate filament-associated protein) [Aphelenchus avenae]
MVHDCKEVNGLDLMTRMEEELEAREVEVSKMLKRITDFAGGLDKTVGLVKLELRSEIRFDEEEQLFVWRKADGGIQLAYEKGRLARLRDSIWRLVAHGRVSASGDSDTLNHYVEDVMHVERERRQLERENVMSKYKVEYVLRRLAKKSELYALQAKAVRDASSKHSQLEEQMTLLKNQLAEATSKAEKKASDAQALQISIDRARAQLDNQRNLHAELQRRAEKLEQEKASGLRRLEELRATNSGLKSQLAEAIKRPQTEKEQVVATLQSREEEIARLKRESHEIYDSKAEAIQRVAQLESQLAASEETAAQLMQQAHALNAALTEMRQPEGTVGRLQNRVRELQAATAELESMRTEICRLRDELQAANLRLSETQMATMQLNAPGTSSSQAVYQAELKHFSDQLYATLVGRAEGYNSIEQLLAEFKEWSGMDGEAKARSVGYISFLDFLRSSEMLERVVIVEEPELGVVYKARQRAEIAHIQQAQAISADHAMRKRVRNEVNKEVGSVKSENYRLRVTLQVEEEKVMTLRTNIDTLSAFVEQKKRAIEELEKQVLCRVCMARNINVVFDCGHVACSICTQRLAKCPMQCPGALVQRPLFL